MKGDVRRVAGSFSYGQGIKRCMATVFLIDVREELSSWPEQHLRERRWVPLQKAKHLAKHGWMARALEATALEELGLGLSA